MVAFLCSIESVFNRRQAIKLKLDALVIVPINISVQFSNEMLNRIKLLQIEKLRFQQAKEVFCTGIVKTIHSTVNGVVHYAGWENSAEPSQGFGQYVCVKASDGRYYYYGHLSEIKVKFGQTVRITDVIGIEGSTGKSTGSHCHYCIRRQFAKGNSFNVAEVSGIPNALGTYDDGYRPPTVTAKRSKTVSLTIDGVTYEGTLTEK